MQVLKISKEIYVTINHDSNQMQPINLEMPTFKKHTYFFGLCILFNVHHDILRKGFLETIFI